jgi:CubicO group peptidase (beta-lactamase class C family)
MPPRTWPMRLSGALAVALLAASACGDDTGAPGDDGVPADDPADAPADDAVDAEDGVTAVYPDEAWDLVDPEDVGFDPERLDAVASEAEGIASACLVVIRHGRLAGEWYWDGTDAETVHEAFSVTKSYASALAGIAQADGDLDIDEPASRYIDEWAGTPSEEITIRDLLSGSSGLHSPAGFDIVGAEDATDYGIALEQEVPPGTDWQNNEPAIQTLERVLSEATGEAPATYAQERIFGPIGARSTAMGSDPSGNTYMFWNLQTTCRDAARFGYLFLRNGAWDGTQVVPEDWIAESTQPSQDANPGYGFLWWLNHGDDEGDRMVATAPAGMYWALGAFGQVIQVDPDSDTVVVRSGESDAVYAPEPLQVTSRVVTEALEDGGDEE